MSFPYFGETLELNESTRAGAEGSFIELSDAVTHYEIGGQGTENVVLVHGFSVPYFIFDKTFDFLAQSGFRVLRYDLFGRGLSDRPRVKYDIHLFVRQLADLLNALDFEAVHLIGLSTGGPITTAFLTQYPDRVRSHVLIDPIGARVYPLPALLKVVRTRGIGELALGMVGSISLTKGLASDLFDSEMIKEFEARYRVQMRYKGFMRAILSTMRNGMLDSFIGTYRRAGELKKPTLLFWGRQDITVPFDHSAELLAAIPHTQFCPIDQCGHTPHFEKAEIVNPILREFLEANAGR